MKIADDSVMCDRKDRRVFVCVDRYDLRGFLHASTVLNCPTDPACYIQRRTNRRTRLADLVILADEPTVDRRSGRTSFRACKRKTAHR